MPAPAFAATSAGVATIVAVVLGVLLIVFIVFAVLAIRRRRQVVEPPGMALPADDFVFAIRRLSKVEDISIDEEDDIDMNMFSSAPISFNHAV